MNNPPEVKMDDIVDRLRADYCSCHDGFKKRGRADPQCESCNTKEERNESADTIERLRAEVEALRTVLRDVVATNPDPFPYLDRGIGTATRNGKAWLAARAAIKETQDA